MICHGCWLVINIFNYVTCMPAYSKHSLDPPQLHDLVIQYATYTFKTNVLGLWYTYKIYPVLNDSKLKQKFTWIIILWMWVIDIIIVWMKGQFSPFYLRAEKHRHCMSLVSCSRTQHSRLGQYFNLNLQPRARFSENFDFSFVTFGSSFLFTLFVLQVWVWKITNCTEHKEWIIFLHKQNTYFC